MTLGTLENGSAKRGTWSPFLPPEPLHALVVDLLPAPRSSALAMR